MKSGKLLQVSVNERYCYHAGLALDLKLEAVVMPITNTFVADLWNIN